MTDHGDPTGPGPFPQSYPAQPGEGPAEGGAGAAPPLVDDPTNVIGARVGQHILDSVVIGAAILVLGLLLGLVLYLVPFGSAGVAHWLVILMMLVWFLGMVAASWLLYAWVPHRYDGQTLAMRWLGLRVVDQHGGPASLGAHTLRWLLLFVDGFFYGIVGLIVMASSARHQRVGDMAAGTLVVRAR